MATPADLSAATLLAMADEDIPAAFSSTLMVLSAPTLQDFPRIVRYVDFDARTFDWERALEEGRTWSDGERKLVKVAATLWGSDSATLREAISLDAANLKRLLAAIEVHEGWKTLRDALRDTQDE